MTRLRLDLFHRVPGVWCEGTPFYEFVWAQISRQLKTGGELNASERRVLRVLVARMRRRPAARKALGIEAPARNARRTARIAQAFAQRVFKGMPRKQAEHEVAQQFPGANTRAIVQSAEMVGRANAGVAGRLLAAQLRKNKSAHAEGVLKAQMFKARKRTLPRR